MTLETARDPNTTAAADRLRIGFIPLVDCAPLVVARDLGFAAAEGLTLELVRETSWANIRDRLWLGHFDAAHMLAPMAIAGRLGLGHMTSPLLAPFVMNQGGNSIALSVALHDEAADWGAFDDPHAAGRALAAVVAARARAGREPPTFAVVHPFSCHDQQLRYWFAAAGLDPDEDLRIVVVPPPYMVDAMASGAVDGICVGAPWSSLAVEAGVGRMLMSTAAVWPAAPEKVLGLREVFVERHFDRATALLRCLDRACAWAEAPENRADLARLLARDEIVGVDVEIVSRALAGSFLARKGGATVASPGFLRFHGTGSSGPVNRPRIADGVWFAAQMVRWRQARDAAAAFDAARRAFSPDLWDATFGRPAGPVSDVVRAFDGSSFDADDPARWLAEVSGTRA